MDKNCLVTKLKAVVNNDSLEKLGVLRIKVHAYDVFSNKKYIGINPGTDDNGIVATISSTFFDASGNDIGNTVPLQPYNGYRLLYPSNESDAVIEISNKYSIQACTTSASNVESINIKDFEYTNVVTLNGNFYGDIKSFAFMPNIEKVIISGGGNSIYGNLDSIKDCTKISIFNVTNNTEISGNISVLGKLKTLTDLGLGFTKCSGSIESFVAAQRLGPNGRTTCDGIDVSYIGNGTSITFNGIQAPTGTGLTLSWTENTITLGGVEINA